MATLGQQDRVLKRLMKVYNLARRGVGGEKENAEAILQSLLAKHNLTIDDLCEREDAQELVWQEYSFRTAYEEQLLIQCACKVINKSSVTVAKIKSKKKSIKMTRLDHIELEALFAYHVKMYRQELKRFQAAYIHQHRLYSDEVDEKDEDDKPLTPEEKLEITRIAQMMSGMQRSKFVSTRKRLAGSGVD